MESKSMKPNISRILIVKFGSLGDIVHCLPSVAQLRAAFPKAEIDWLVERKNKIAVDLSGLDVRLVPIDTYHWRNSPGIGSAREIAEFFWALRTDGYDCAIDFQGLIKSAFFAYLSGAPLRIGWERDFLKESVSHFFYTEVVKPKRIHIIDQQMELLIPLGIEPDWYAEVPLKAGAAARKSVEGKLRGLADYVLINPGGNWVTKVWHAATLRRACRTPDEGWIAGSSYLGTGRRKNGAGPGARCWRRNPSDPNDSRGISGIVREGAAVRRRRHRPDALRGGRRNTDRFDLRTHEQRPQWAVPA